MQEFLARHASSPRADQISVMLGWLLLDAGDTAAASQRFSAAQDDPRAAVRASARAGLTAINDARPAR